MTVYPDFYDAFCCTAERCRHTCCRGWEIDIDADTAARYRAMEGPLGERLRAAIDWSDGASFRLAEDERCKKLAYMILELAENGADAHAYHQRLSPNETEEYAQYSAQFAI